MLSFYFQVFVLDMTMATSPGRALYVLMFTCANIFFVETLGTFTRPNIILIVADDLVIINRYSDKTESYCPLSSV